MEDQRTFPSLDWKIFSISVCVLSARGVVTALVGSESHTSVDTMCKEETSECDTEEMYCYDDVSSC